MPAIRGAFSDDPVLRTSLEVGGEYLYRMRGENHAWSPDSVACCNMLCAAACRKSTASLQPW